MSPGGQAILCLEPPIQGPRHSGGFFYNDCLALAAVAHAGGRSRSRTTSHPRFTRLTWDGGSLPPATVLLDSLWWYVHKRPLDVLADALAGRSWGLVMHGLPAESSGLLGDIAKASFVVVPSFWAAGQLEAVRSSVAAGGQLDVRVLYPGWDGQPGLVPGPARRGSFGDIGNIGDGVVRIASSSNWTRTKGLVQAACALGRLSRNPACPPWIWQAAGTPDPGLIEEAHSGLGPLASRLNPLGHLDPAALVRLLHGSDIFLHPSGQETFCLSVFEAALAGCWVVARAIGGVPEAIQLARLLRRQLGLPLTGVHLAPAAILPIRPDVGPYSPEMNPSPPGVIPAEAADQLVEALEAAFAAVVDPSIFANPATWANPENLRVQPDHGKYANLAASKVTGVPRKSSTPPTPSILEGLLQEFSWQGRLEKLLRGESDRALPAIIQPEQVEAS